MSTRPGRPRARWLVPSLLMVAMGCKSSQLQTARVISEDRNTMVVAISENTPKLRAKAEKLAQSRLGRDMTFVDGKEVTTTDNKGSQVTRTSFIKGKREFSEAVYRREYQVTFRRSRTTGD